jgi:hypothetical protein
MPEEKVLELLSEDRQEKLRGEHQRMQSQDMDIGYIDILLFSDIVNIICKDQTLRKLLGFDSRKQAEESLNSLVPLRNDIVHTVREMGFIPIAAP